MSPIQLPHLFTPRSYQRPVFAYFDQGGDRAVVVAHRRSGKDVMAENWIVRDLWLTPGIEGYYVLPTYTHAKRTMWVGRTDQRRAMLDFIPRNIVKARHESELRIVLTNQSQLSFVGSEQLDALMGTNPSRLVFSEYALQRPDAWDYLRPIVAQNRGKVLFVSTPRGRNHLWSLYAMAERDPAWFTSLQTVATTRRDAVGEDVGPVIDETAIDRERLEGMPENLVQQEFYCSFAEAVSGAIYGREMAAMEAEGRLTRVPYHPGKPVVAAWDIARGVTAITVAQVFPTRVQVIDYLELQGQGIHDAVAALAQKPYRVTTHIGPHDLQQEEWANEKSRLGTARALGVKFRVLPRVSIDEGVHAARLLLPWVWADERGCRDLVAALSHYRRDWDEDRKVFTVRARDDWATHGADSLRYLALGLREGDAEVGPRPRPQVKNQFDAITGRPRAVEPTNRGTGFRGSREHHHPTGGTDMSQRVQYRDERDVPGEMSDDRAAAIYTQKAERAARDLEAVKHLRRREQALDERERTVAAAEERLRELTNTIATRERDLADVEGRLAEAKATERREAERMLGEQMALREETKALRAQRDELKAERDAILRRFS